MSDRRLPRARRVVTATVLLMTTVLAAVVGVVAATVPVLIGSTLYAVVGGVVSARLIADELTQMRRDWARDRADLSDGFRKAAVIRSREQIAFAEQMGSRISLRDSQIATLREATVTAEIELAQARERLSAERARSEALLADVTSAQTDLESARMDLRGATDALAASESAELQVRTELLAWEQAATEDVRRERDRKPA